MARKLISICVSHYRRSAVRWAGGYLYLFPNAVKALNQAVAESGLAAELVVADWPYVSQENHLRLWLWAESRIPVRIVEMDRAFTLGAGRNAAAKAAQSDLLYFMDADMLTPPEVLTRGVEVVAAGKGYFPICRRFRDASHTEWAWTTGHGNSVVSREHWRQAGGFSEAPGRCGEDTMFGQWFKARKIYVREEVRRYIHQWHPK